jgi:uncharacterized protein with GYD domain
MRTFIILATFTEQGLRKLQDTTERVRAFRQNAEENGVKVKEIFWTRGAVDLVAVLEAPDESNVASLTVAVDSRGNVRTQTLRAFPVEVMEEMLAKVMKASVPA